MSTFGRGARESRDSQLPGRLACPPVRALRHPVGQATHTNSPAHRHLRKQTAKHTDIS